jgi:hypothetical protein
MKLNRAIVGALGLIVVASLVPRRSDGQSIEQRVNAVENGKVRFTFAAKPGVCGMNNSISRGGSNRYSWSSDLSPDVEYDTECSKSPVRVVLEVRDGQVARLRTYVGGRWRESSAARDLGSVSTKAATDYLLSVASTKNGSVAHEAIMTATLADSVSVWPDLARLAKDESRPSSTRKQALFWLGQEAGEKIGGGTERSDPDTEIKKQAVFALSQQRNGESVPTLIEVARRNRDPDVRRTALFWLGQTNDPRAVALFEELLSR